MLLSNYFIKKKIKELLKNSPSRAPKFCSLEEAEHLFLVFNLKDVAEVLPCIEKLQEFRKDVHICAYVPRQHKEEVDPSWMLVREEELDSKGIPTPEMAGRFTAVAADILIDLTRSTCYPMHYLLLQHPSRFKVGNKSSLKSMFDMTVPISEGEQINQVFEHLLFYLLTIRSK